MAEILSLALATGEYSDLTIKCQGNVFKVHQIIVCGQSKPLAAHVKGPFLEAATNEIDLPDDESDIVKCMLSFLYTADYPVKAPEELEDGLALLKHAKVYVMAEKYDVAALKVLATKKYEAALATDWNTSSLSPSLKLLYEETPESERTIKEAAAAALREHVAELLDRGEFVALCKEHGEIGVDVFKASLMALALAKAENTKCPICANGEYRSKSARCSSCNRIYFY